MEQEQHDISLVWRSSAEGVWTAQIESKGQVQADLQARVEPIYGTALYTLRMTWLASTSHELDEAAGTSQRGFLMISPGMRALMFTAALWAVQLVDGEVHTHPGEDRFVLPSAEAIGEALNKYFQQSSSQGSAPCQE